MSRTRTRADIAVAPWDLRASEYPHSGTAVDRARALVSYAVLAPSAHNSQPWAFRLGDGVIDVLADRTRRLPVVDPDGRELTMSVGAALGTLLVAAHRFGWHTRVAVFPEPDEPDLVARVALAPGAPVDDELFGAITSRRTTRLEFENRALPEDLQRDLVVDAHHEHARLDLFTGRERAALAELVAEADVVQMADPAFRRELAAWLRPNTGGHRDGIRGYGLGLSDVMAALGPLVVRTFDTGRRQAARDRQLAQGAPHLAVVSTAADDPVAWVAAGRALARVLLRLAAHGATASFLSQPVEIPTLRARVADLVSHRDCGVPQLLLRIGHGPDVPPEPRRPVDDVLVGGTGRAS